MKSHLDRDASALITYRGYLKFLKTDIKYAKDREGVSKNTVKRMNSDIAKKMICRGTVCFRVKDPYYLYASLV